MSGFLLRRLDQVGALVAHVADVAADRVPGERLGRFALVQHDLFRALWRRRRVKPLACQLGRQHDGAAVVNVDGVMPR